MRDFVDQITAIANSMRKPIDLLHQPTVEQLQAARYVKQYLETNCSRMFNSYFSQYTDRMFAQVSTTHHTKLHY